MSRYFTAFFRLFDERDELLGTAEIRIVDENGNSPTVLTLVQAVEDLDLQSYRVRSVCFESVTEISEEEYMKRIK